MYPPDDVRGTLETQQRIRMAAAAAVRRLPDFRGRQRLSRAILGHPAVRTRIRFGPGIELDLDLRDADHRMAFFLQSQPPVLAPIFDEVVGPGDTVIDVGANQGIYTLWAASRVAPGGSVHAFEPIASTRAMLEGNVQRNERDDLVVIRPEAIGSRSGRLTLYPVPNFSGLTGVYKRCEDTRGVDVPVTALDQYCEEHALWPRLIKVDIEGYETEALRGMSTLLTRSDPPVVILECIHSQLEAAGSSVQELLEEIRRSPLEAWVIRGGRLRPFTGGTCEQGNLVLLHPLKHAGQLQRLRSVRFSRDDFP